ncbi:tRNA 2-thiouridine(34) synthase MnmA [Candidatus Falkowbacteria bacterium]|nr:tRNA 2-thiouridine(34) synthase MnmA [Candidatus Falkowbacteria bacterium]
MTNTKSKKVVVAMSGGLDSSTAAKILKDKGYEVIGIFMCFGIDGKCCDQGRARRVCRELGIKFYPVDLSHQFKKRVKDYFLQAYEKGLTPNPCAACNKFIKFGELLKIAKQLGCEYLATGHYIKLKKEKGVYKVLRPADKKKDQTYFLYSLTQDQLKHLLFPLADKKKDNIRKEAQKHGLPYIKKESQDVCFLPDDHNIYLKQNLKLKPGEIKTLDGKVVGRHQGLPLYTIGQRRGIEIGGSGPYYVARKDQKDNVLYVSEGNEDPGLYKKETIIKDINWISGQEPKMPFSCQAVIRYGHKEAPCQVEIAGKKRKVVFAEAQRAITPGQNIAFYKQDELLGGGVIIE